MVSIIIAVIAGVCLIALCVVFTLALRHYTSLATQAAEAGADDPLLVHKALGGSRWARALKKVLSWFWKAILGLVLLAALIAMAAAIYVRVSGNQFPFGDRTVMVVSSGSMSKKNPLNEYLENYDDQIDTYDAIVIERYENQEQVRKYDVIAYRSDDGTTIVHRIVDAVETPSGIQYVTRGDANSADDSGSFYGEYLPYSRIIGRYTGQRLPAVGFVVVFLQSPAGIMTLVALSYCFVVYDVLISKRDRIRAARTSFVLTQLNVSPKQVKSGEYTDIERITISGREYSFFEGVLTPLGEKEVDHD